MSRPSNKPFSRLRSLLNFRIIFSRLLRSLKTPTGIHVNGVLDISICLRFTKPSKAPGSIDVVVVDSNSTFSSCGFLTKAPLGIVSIWLDKKKNSVTPGLRRLGISVVDELKTSWFSLGQSVSLSHSWFSEASNSKDKIRTMISPLDMLIHLLFPDAG